MPIFQQSVLKKYLNDLSESSIKNAWSRFRSHFQDPAIQENICSLKEEEYQEGFVRDLFVNIFGYILNPQPGFNLVLEKKSVTDATKSDGAILSGKEVIAVIELKDTGTPDLEKVSNQAFGYKHKHKNCTYVITSNFEKLRFYIHDSTEYEEFDLFNLSYDKFSLLYLCLEKECLLSNLPLEVKEASLLREETITKKLYEDYSVFKRTLFYNITELNPQFDKLLLFKKTQKLLDRFLFILFAEDRLLVPPNSVREILQQWEDLKTKYDEYFPLYERFNKYFGYLNQGHRGKQHEIFAYNGGLFAEDEVLNDIKIDDTVLHDGSIKLSGYDFETDVDVNILGHIFEHSLTEIEELQAELEGKPLEKSKTKRKKEGVFYTPRYITKYMVENTVGDLCTNKKLELQIDEKSFAPGKRKDNRRKLIEKLNNYREWLLQLTICDPACGSGAFLNAALEYLIAEHRMLDELKARVFGASIVYSDIENSILENNLYGVDINEDAIEIAKLSLWLRTAQKGRKLSNLSSNLKCGNSLINDSNVAGEKAFSWENEFPIVFEKGGFDVIVGNPPYVDVKNLPDNIKKYLFNNYTSTENRINLYSTFIERGLSLLNDFGTMSFINPNSMLVNSSYKNLRLLIIDSLVELIKLPDDVFVDAKVETMIFILKKGSRQTIVSVLPYKKDEKITSIERDRFFRLNKEDWKKDENLNFNFYASGIEGALLSKIEHNAVPLIELGEFSLGLTPYDKYKGHTEEEIKNRVFHSKEQINSQYKPLISGENIVRYYTLPKIEEYIRYGEWLSRPREERFFNKERIIVRQILSGNPPRIYASYANQPYYFTHHGFALIPKGGTNVEVKYLLTLLNSSLINFYHSYKFLDIEKRLFQKVLIENFKRLPIKVPEEQHPFIDKADSMLSLKQEEYSLIDGFLHFLFSKFVGLALNKKLVDWPNLSFNEFTKELSKQGFRISLSEQKEWLTYFDNEKQKSIQIQNMIMQTDKEIDAMVYELYGLTEAEIQILEQL